MENKIKNIGCLIMLVLTTIAFPTLLLAQSTATDSLDYYIAVAVQNNPGTKAQKLAYEAYLEKIPQAGAFDDPEFTGEFYPSPMNIIGGRSIANFSVMQRFPWFGTRKLARMEAGYESEMQFQQYKSAMDNLILQVSVQWYSMQRLNEQINNNMEQKKFLKNLEELALRRYAAPSGSASPGMSDVLRIRLEQTEVDNNIESLKALLRSEKAKFNMLLNRDVNETVNIGNAIFKTTFLFQIEDILKSIDANNPDLLMIEKEIMAYKAKAEKDKKMSYPMLGIGVQYMLIGKTNEEMFKMGSMNGRDMVMPMVSVSLPLFRKKYHAQQNESVLWQQSNKEKRENTYNNLKSDLYGFKNQLDDAERSIALYEKQTELALTTYNLTVQEFVTGKGDLTNVIQVQRQLLDYQLKKAEAIAGYNSMAVSIEKLTSFNTYHK